MSNEVEYDGYNFGNAGIVFTNINPYLVPEFDNQIEDRAHRSGGLLVQSKTKTKSIPLGGYYQGSDTADAQAMYDTLTGVLNKQQKVLTVPHAGSTRDFIATPQNIVIQNPDGLNRLTFSFVFVVPSGASEDETDTTIINQTITNSTETIPFTIAGSTTARPYTNIVVNSVTGGASKTMSIRNASDLVGLTFSRTFVAGDIITIDSANFQLYINGVLTEPDGRLPTWEPGPGALYYADTFTTRDVSITSTYNIGNI
jgi:hypothetical protein